jgi:hypothetical protein
VGRVRSWEQQEAPPPAVRRASPARGGQPHARQYLAQRPSRAGQDEAEREQRVDMLAGISGAAAAGEELRGCFAALLEKEGWQVQAAAQWIFSRQVRRPLRDRRTPRPNVGLPSTEA